MSYTVEHVEITFQDGSIGRMQIVAKAPIRAFHPDLAIAHGFAAEGGEDAAPDQWVRNVTDETIANEIARTLWPQPVVSWQRV